MSCIPGSPKTGGRKKGTPNKCRKSIDYFAEQAFKKVDMVQKGIELLNHKDPRVQAMVWCRLMDYKFGRPREQLVISGSVDMRSVVAKARERVMNMRKSLPIIEIDRTAESEHILDSGRSNGADQLLENQQLG